MIPNKMDPPSLIFLATLDDARSDGETRKEIATKRGYFQHRWKTFSRGMLMYCKRDGYVH